MRLTKALLALAATASLSALAAAQDVAPQAPAAKAEAETPPPAEGEAQPATGLSGLEDTLSTLTDEQAQTEAPPRAETPATPPPAAETPAPAAETPPPAETTPPPAETTPPPTPRPTAPAAPLTDAQQAQLTAAVQRGRLLFALARAGNIATQDMLSRISDPDGAGIAGWIAEPEGNAITVTFYSAAAGDAPPSAVYRVTVLGARATERSIYLTGDKPPLNPRQARMAAARAATDGLDHTACGGDSFNVLVVPPASATSTVEVYQISPQTERGRLPVGGHFRTAIGPGGAIGESRGFTNSCLIVDVPDTPAGQRPAPLAVTHLLDPLPTEIHVLLSLLSGHPLVVVAGDPQRLFGVTGEGIGELRE